MEDNIVQFPHFKNRAERLEEQKDAGREARRRMRSSGAKLNRDERRSIASRLDDEIKKSSVTPSHLAEELGLKNGLRELDKMRFRQGSNPDKDLLAYGYRYLAVIEKLAELTAQNANLLADRVTAGTRVHPLRAAGNLGEIDKTLAALQSTADQVDKEIDLFTQYRDTLRLKCEAFARGELDDWPYYPRDEYEIPGGTEADWSDPQHETLRREWDELVDGRYGFWGRDYRSDDYIEGIDIKALGCIPHAYLGILMNWKYWIGKDDLRQMRKLRDWMKRGYIHTPTAVYREGNLPTVENLTIQDKDILNDYEFTHVNDFPHSWLILFPDRAMTRIVPGLLTLNGDLGSTVEIISAGTLLELQQTEVVGQQDNAYDVIVELLASQAGGSLAEHWTETGRWFRQNPFLRRADRVTQARIRRDALFFDGDRHGED